MSSSLTTLAHEVRSKLTEATSLDPTQIVIGPPHEAARQQENAPDKDYLCVFFYRMEYSGVPADAASDDPLYLKVFGMITALGGRSSGVTPGDAELRLIGEVVEYFHRNPVLKLSSGAKIKVVPTQLSLDDINHLWATQNNTPYRLSLSYEFTLLQVPLQAHEKKQAKNPKEVVLNVSGSLESKDSVLIEREGEQ